MKTNVIITNHAAMRLLERTPFEEKNFSFIASYAYDKSQRSSGEKGYAISAYLDTLACERASRSDNRGHFVAKLHGQYVFIFNEADDGSVLLITVVEFHPEKVKALVVKKMYR